MSTFPQPPGTIRMEMWSVGHLHPYRAPEANEIVMRGHIEGRGRVRTSPVVATAGRVVTTESGSRYFLAEPDPEYIAWLASEGRTLDEAEPVKVLRRRSS